MQNLLRKLGWILTEMEPSTKHTRSESAGEKDRTLEVIRDTDEFVQKFQALYNSENLSDIILRVQDNRFYAHRFILVASSEVFEAMLARWKESEQTEIVLEEDEECEAIFADFLKYLYSGTVEITTKKVHALMMLADKYAINVLRKSCIDYMARHIVESPCTNRTLTWYQYAKLTESEDLQKKCVDFIRSNFVIVQEASDWLNLSIDDITEFLSSSEICVRSEYSLWKDVEKWLTTADRNENIRENLEQILPCIRFSMMTPRELYSLESSQIYTDHKDMFMESVMNAHRHHSLQSDPSFQMSDGDPFRNYSQENYKLSATLNLENFHGRNIVESLLKTTMTVPYQFYAPGVKEEDSKQLKFVVVFFPKGFYVMSSLYNAFMSKHSDLTSLKIRCLATIVQPVKVEITFLLYGRRNGVTYVAHTFHTVHTFSAKSNTCDISNVIDLKKINSKESLFLVNGNLKARCFLKIQAVLKEEQETSN